MPPSTFAPCTPRLFRKRRRCVFILLTLTTLVCPGGNLRAAEVTRLVWATQYAAAPASANPELSAYLPMLRPALENLAEAAVVQMAVSQAPRLGIQEKEAEQLGGLLERRYDAIALDPVFKNVASAQPYCFVAAHTKQGLAYLYRPNRTTTETTRVIVFLHGEGGAFLYYLHQMAQWFPDQLILCPAYGIEPSKISATYLTECLRAASLRCGHPLAKPVLVGISAGGSGLARVYASTPENYAQLILLAAVVPPETARRWPAGGRIRVIAGDGEDTVKSGEFSSMIKTLTTRSSSVQTQLIPKADRFFMLTNPGDTRRALKAWITPPPKN